MGDSIQKVLQRRGDKKRKSSGVNSLQFLSPLIVPLLLLLALFSLLTGFVKGYPVVFISYSISLLSYLVIERFFFKKDYEPNRNKQGLSSSTLKIFEIITASVIIVRTISPIFSERWSHLLYLPLMMFISIKFQLIFILFAWHYRRPTSFIR